MPKISMKAQRENNILASVADLMNAYRRELTVPSKPSLKGSAETFILASLQGLMPKGSPSNPILKNIKKEMRTYRQEIALKREYRFIIEENTLNHVGEHVGVPARPLEEDSKPIIAVDEKCAA